MGHPANTGISGPSGRAPRAGRRCCRFARVLAGLALAGMLGVAGLAHFIDRYGQVDRARPADAIVVLGARVDERGEPGDSLRARTLHAVALYERGLAPKILCTGGVGDHPPSEAEAAAALARSRGVPASDLVLESRSTSTRENALYAAKIRRAKGWHEVIVVSDPYHLWRARRELTRAGLVAYPSPALDCARNRVLHRRFFWAVREVLALARDHIPLLAPRPRPPFPVGKGGQGG